MNDTSENNSKLSNDHETLYLVPLSIPKEENEQINDKKPMIYTCTICNTPFNKMPSLIRHSKIHDTTRKQYACHVCNKTYSRKDTLRRHLLSHTLDKKYKCHNCNFKTSRSDTLKKHQRIFEH